MNKQLSLPTKQMYPVSLSSAQCHQSCRVWLGVSIWPYLSIMRTFQIFKALFATVLILQRQLSSASWPLFTTAAICPGRWTAATEVQFLVKRIRGCCVTSRAAANVYLYFSYLWELNSKFYLDSRRGKEIFLPSKASRPALGPIQPPIKWALGREDDHWPSMTRLGISGAITPFPHMPLWCTQGKILNLVCRNYWIATPVYNLFVVYLTKLSVSNDLLRWITLYRECESDWSYPRGTWWRIWLNPYRTNVENRVSS